MKEGHGDAVGMKPVGRAPAGQVKLRGSSERVREKGGRGEEAESGGTGGKAAGTDASPLMRHWKDTIRRGHPGAKKVGRGPLAILIGIGPAPPRVILKDAATPRATEGGPQGHRVEGIAVGVGVAVAGVRPRRASSTSATRRRCCQRRSSACPSTLAVGCSGRGGSASGVSSAASCALSSATLPLQRARASRRRSTLRAASKASGVSPEGGGHGTGATGATRRVWGEEGHGVLLGLQWRDIVRGNTSLASTEAKLEALLEEHRVRESTGAAPPGSGTDLRRVRPGRESLRASWVAD